MNAQSQQMPQPPHRAGKLRTRRSEAECLVVVIGYLQELRAERERLGTRHIFRWRANRDAGILAINQQIKEWEEVEKLIFSKL